MHRTGRPKAQAKPLSPRTVRYVHTILHRALGYAGRKNLVNRNVTDMADPPTAGSGGAAADYRVWSPEELRRLLDHVHGDRLFALWVLLATSGTRRGEALGLSWEDVDLDAGRLKVRRTLIQVGYAIEWSTPKTAHGRRTMTIDAFRAGALREHRARQLEKRIALGAAYHDQDLVFCREDGEVVHPDRLTKMFSAHARAAGLPKIRLHDLRHGWASHAVAAGVDIRTVSSRLGHADPGFTMRVYAHRIEEAEAAAAEAVARRLLG